MIVSESLGLLFEHLLGYSISAFPSLSPALSISKANDDQHLLARVPRPRLALAEVLKPLFLGEGGFLMY